MNNQRIFDTIDSLIDRLKLQKNTEAEQEEIDEYLFNLGMELVNNQNHILETIQGPSEQEINNRIKMCIESIKPIPPSNRKVSTNKPHSFCETPKENCTINYCDDNGCNNRKRNLVNNLKTINKQ